MHIILCGTLPDVFLLQLHAGHVPRQPGYFVLFAASKSDDRRLKLFGRVLAIWLFTIPALILIMGAYASLSGLCSL